MQDAIADLHYIIGYAEAVREQLLQGQSPTVGYLNRMAELADKVQKTFDPELEVWANNHGCTN